MKINFIVACGLSWLLSVATTPALGMDRWSARFQIESGNNDAAIRRAGEVNRNKIKPLLLQKYGSPLEEKFPELLRCHGGAGRCWPNYAQMDAQRWHPAVVNP